MSVEFDEENTPIYNRMDKQRSGIIGFLLQKGLVKTVRQANIVLIVLLLILLVVTFVAIGSSNKEVIDPNDPTEEELLA
tara:strand:- start:549 stop:785 length:237 start_codon:yes stop_codon:yes gene_type:complete